MNRLMIGMAALALAAAPASTAQQTPDFSGTWSLSSYRGNVAGGGGRGSSGGGAMGGGGTGGSVVVGGGPRRTPVGQTVTVRQTPASVTIDEAMGDATRRMEYRLDGSESVNTRDNVTLRTRSRWENGRLVTEGTQTVRTGQTDVTAAFSEVRWLETDGTMVIETTRQLEGRDPTTSRAEYTKQG